LTLRVAGGFFGCNVMAGLMVAAASSACSLPLSVEAVLRYG
jgi:hypothetical protein